MNEQGLRLEVRKVLNEWSEKHHAAIDSMMTPKKEEDSEELSESSDCEDEETPE